MSPESATVISSRSRIGVALILGVAWFLAMAWWTADFVHNYYPLGDEFALLANSYPGMAVPLQWLTEGFSGYFVSFPGLTVPITNFIRPVFNLAYWLVGWLVAPTSGAFLYFNFLVLASCSALAYLALTADRKSQPVFILLAAAAPLTPPLLPSVGPLLLPCLAFDPLAAVFCLLAYLAYRSERICWCVVWLLLAVFTKETALPVAATLPAIYLWHHRKQLAESRILLRLAALSTPVVLWYVVRTLAFEHVTGGIYVLAGASSGKLTGLVHNAVRWPFWFQDQSLRSLFNPGVGNLQAKAALAANIGLMAAAAFILLCRLRQRCMPEVEELCFLASYAFMILVGNQVRFGAVLSMFLIVSLGLWLRESRGTRLAIFLPLVVCLGLGATLWQGWNDLGLTTRRLSSLHRVAADYVDTLSRFASGDRVIVLNDPVTMTTSPDMLRLVTGVRAGVEKLSDYSCPWTLDRLDSPCKVGLQEVAPGHFRFSQSCGLMICSASPEVLLLPMERHLANNASASYHNPSEDTDENRTRIWDSVDVYLPEGDAQLVWYDPATGKFGQLNVPAKRD